jgi:hypothetical protein
MVINQQSKNSLSINKKYYMDFIFLSFMNIFYITKKYYKLACTVVNRKYKYYPICLFKETNVFPATIANSCDAQLSLHSYAISINYTKFHLSKSTTLFMVNFFIYFLMFT